MQQEFDAKYVEVQKVADQISEAALEAELKVLASMQNRIDTYRQSAGEELNKKRQEEYAPIIKKANEAINAVAAENGYTYIFDNASQVIVVCPSRR